MQSGNIAHKDNWVLQIFMTVILPLRSEALERR
jgi:hypothetical protein